MLAVGGWGGDLHICSRRVRHRLTLKHGALVGAASSDRKHHLGELIVRRGLLSACDLVAWMSPHLVGKLLIERGLIEREQWVEMLDLQAARIFHDALLVRAGSFSFVVPNESEDRDALRCDLPIEHLILEAAQRIDEMSLYRATIPGGDARPVLTAPPTAFGSDPDTRSIVARMDGIRSIRDISEEIDLDEFQVTRAVHRLLQGGLATIQQVAVGQH